MTSRRHFLLACAALASGLARATAPAGIRARMQAFVDAGTIAGAVILVQQRGELLALDAVGWRNAAERAPMQPDTVFQVMSQSKPFIAAAVMLLQDAGKLDAEHPAAAYLPEFARHPKITIAQLLAHTSGLPDAAPETRSFATKMGLSLAEVTATLARQPLEAGPGTRWRYSNQGIAVAARIVEVVSGQPYEQFVAERLFAPLDMRDSCFRPVPALYPRIAACYEMKHGALREMGDGSLGAGDLKLRVNTRYPLPEAGIFSTAVEIARFHQLMLQRGQWGGRRILSERCVAMMLAPRIAAPKHGAQALGWRIQPNRIPEGGLVLPPGTIHHSGAFGSFGFADPTRQLVGIMLVQRPAAVDERDTFLDAVNIACGVEKCA